MTDSGASTPRFTSQGTTAEDLLKSQTVGLVQLDEFRKRRRDVEELRMKEAQAAGDSDGTLTPRSESRNGSRAGTPGNINNTNIDGAGFKKKKRKLAPGKGLLSFGGDEDNEGDSAGIGSGTSTPISWSKNAKKPVSPNPEDSVAENKSTIKTATEPLKRKLTPNPNAGLPAPRVMTKAALAAEVAERERLRKEFIEVQELVRSTEIAIPFVFYDGSNLPGGMVKVKKGDHIWLFLERCRKVGAEMGVGGDRGDGAGVKTKLDGRKSWARIGVDDLMCVRGEIIIPHHYEFYYFIANKVKDPTNPDKLLFDYSGTAPPKAAGTDEPLLRNPRDEKAEGQDDDPVYTKVVDRRWYEKNKHIYPASLWKEYKAGKEFEDSAKSRKDGLGNSFFFS